MNRRDTVIALLACVALAAPLAARGQPRGKLPRIGYLTLRSRGHELEAAFVAGMRERGYVDGKNITIEWRFAVGKAEPLPALAAELVALRVDLIVAAGTQAIQAAAAATKIVPIVFPVNVDPVGMRFVRSLARPGGNITGISTLAADLGEKLVELLHAVVPRLSLIAVLVNPTNPGSALVIKSIEAGARKKGVSIQQFEAQTLDGIERAFAAMAAARADAVTIAIDSYFLQVSREIAELALRRKLPFISTQEQDADAGGLLSYGANNMANYRLAATYVDKILKGARPADLPVQQPTLVELVLNLKTAKALGITMPYALMARADRVIE